MSEFEVVIAGAGPAGLTAAIALARQGVETLVVERRPRPSPVPRATTLSLATMELMRAWGLEPALRAGGIDVEMQPWVCRTLTEAGDGVPMDAGFPTLAQSALISPTAPAGVPQSHFEPVLEAHLRSFATARVERGVEVSGVEQDGDGVRVRLRDGAGERHVDGAHLIGADGIRSTVRDAAGIPLVGREELGERLVVSFTAPLWDRLGDRRSTIYLVMGAGRVCFFVPTGGDRWVFGADWDPARDRAEDLSPAGVRELIRAGAGDPGLEPRIGWIGTVPYGVHLAARFRERRILLAGDAAHRVTPRGATGLNAAVRDGRDLGWKLGWVARGWAGEALLDSYEAERRPVAEYNVARSSRPDGSEGEAGLETRRDLGGRIPHIWLPGRERSTLDLLGDGLTLLTGPSGDAWRMAAAAPGGDVELLAHELDAQTAWALGIAGNGALLARPDGRPVALWSGDVDAQDALRDAVASATARPPVAV